MVRYFYFWEVNFSKKCSNNFSVSCYFSHQAFFMNQNVQSIGRTFGDDYLMNIVGEKLRDSRITKIELYINSHEKFKPNRD